MGIVSFFATGQGVLLLAAVAAAAVLIWDWRVMLVALFLLQAGIAALVTTVAHAPGQIVLVQTLVMGLCCIMLATSGLQVQLERAGRQSGGWFFRLLALALLATGLYSLNLRVQLPLITPGATLLLMWLGLVALLMLSLGDNPLFTSVALLLWCAIGQGLAAVYMPQPQVLVVLGVAPLTIALTCSYLIVAERMPRANRRTLYTDISFPTDDSAGGGDPVQPAPAHPPAPVPPWATGTSGPANPGAANPGAANPGSPSAGKPPTTSGPSTGKTGAARLPWSAPAKGTQGQASAGTSEGNKG